MLATLAAPILLPFPHDWSKPIARRDAYLTDAVVARDGAEWRALTRQEPQRRIGLRLLGIPKPTSERILNAVRLANGQRFLVPAWHDVTKLTADVAAASSALPCDTSYRSFVAGGQALLHRSDGYELVEIDAVSPGSLELALVVVDAWPRGTRVVPVWSCVLPQLPTIARETPAAAALEAEFIEMPPIVGLELAGAAAPMTPTTIALRFVYEGQGASPVLAPGDELLVAAAVKNVAGDTIPGAPISWSSSRPDLMTIRAVHPLGHTALIERTSEPGVPFPIFVTFTATSGAAEATTGGVLAL